MRFLYELCDILDALNMKYEVVIDLKYTYTVYKMLLTTQTVCFNITM